MQVYDLAWSPTGEYIIAGSTDNAARVFAAIDGKCVYEIAEHSHYVQGVAWDPLNEYIATQSSDRSMHVYAYLLNQAVPLRLMLLVRTQECHGAILGDIVVLRVHTVGMVPVNQGCSGGNQTQVTWIQP